MTAAPRRLLVINPNTSRPVSDLLHKHVGTDAGAGVEVRTMTARFGSPYIVDEASYAVAAHATLDAWQAATTEASGDGAEPYRPDAVLIGCFGDPGLWALREVCGVPVTGLAEASFIEAAKHGRFAVVTGGERWGPMLTRLALTLGYAEALAGVHTVAPTGAQLAADPGAARALLAQACREAARELAAHAVILGGAGLAGMAAGLQSALNVPLIDSVRAGARQAFRGEAALAPRTA